jgi:hypothetical protein
MNSKSILALAAGLSLAVFTSSIWAGGSYSGGDGSAENPYRIATPNDLNDIGNHVEDFNKCFVMVNDINLADYNGTQFNIIGTGGNPFTGVFDGNDNSILNFSYEISSGYNIGLFRIIDEPNAVIEKLSMLDPNINGGTGDGVGALVGELANGTISGLVGQARRPYGVKTLTNCYLKCTVSGDSGVGGVVGVLWATKGEAIMSDCASAGSVSGNNYVGGLVGSLECYITGCHSSAIVSGEDGVGGLIGWAQGQPYYLTQIIDCSADGNVTATGDNIGGLVGQNGESYISDCCGTGDVEGSSVVGGLVGTNGNGTITFCYAAGNVTCTDWLAGGLLGENYSGNITNCYGAGSVSGASTIGGLIGWNQAGDISNCFALGEVRAVDGFAGGLVGENSGDIANSYAGGSVTSNVSVGGLLGANYGSIVHCYVCGAVDGNDVVGGIAGEDHHFGSFSKCFWDTNISPDVNGVGSGSDPNVIGKPTAEMQTESTFAGAGWDFVEVWNIGENQTYPFLRAYPAGDLNHDGIVNFADVAILADHWLESYGVE